MSTEFRFQPNNGTFKTALVEALDSLEGLQASYLTKPEPADDDLLIPRA